MAKITDLYASHEKVKNGVWKTNEYGMQFLIVPAENNVPFKKAVMEIAKENRPLIRAKNLSDEDFRDMLKPAVAKHIIKDWKDVEDKDGNSIQFSPEKALEVFNDPEIWQGYIYVFIYNEAYNFNNYRKDSEKNS